MAQITDPNDPGLEEAPAEASAAALRDERGGRLYVETDGRGRIVETNAAWADLLGWTAEDIGGLPLESLVHPHDVPREGLLAAPPFSLRFRCKAGGWLHCGGVSKRRPDGGLLGWFGGSVMAEPDRPLHIEPIELIEPDEPAAMASPPVDPPQIDQPNPPTMPEDQVIVDLLALTAGIWRWSIDPVLLTVNMLSGDQTGEDVRLVMTMDELVASAHSDDLAPMTDRLTTAMQDGGSGTFVVRLKRIAGGWKSFRVTYITEPHESGRHTVHGLSQDVSEVAEVRDTAVQSADRLGLALSAAGAAVAEIDFERRRTWCSPGFVEIIGQTLGFEGPDPRPWPMCHDEDRERLDAALDEWTDDRHQAVQFRVVHPSGDCRWVEVTGERELGEAGELAKITCLVLDIEERKQQELALARLRQDAQGGAERLQVAMDAARAGVFETDFVNESFWCSPEFEEIVGGPMSFEEAAGVWPIMHPDDVAKIGVSIDKSNQGSGSECAEFRIRRPSGEYRWIEARAVVHHDPEGKVERLTGVVLDIDARKRQELALIEAERSAQSAAVAKTQFLANMSHEIRTPMNGVLGVLQLLGGENLSAEAKGLLEEAERCGRMLSQLLNDVVDISKIEAGRLELELEALDPKALVVGVADLLRSEATAKGLTLDVHVEGEDVWVMADPVRLRQALFNLIGNAVKFTTAGRVEARLFISKFPGRRRLLRFEIEDTGVGIPIGVQPTLFERFTQADGSSERRFGGSGLGLAITRRLAELMGGAVTFSSTEGIGSIFSLEFPAAEAEALVAVAESQADDAPPLAGLNILVVEDNATNRMVATKLLESLGARVEIAEDGVEGVEAVRQRPYDLVLMDIQMPRMDGVEATRQIRALEGDVANIPIVALTANVMASQMQTYLEVGMNGVAAKPISLPALLGEIARAFQAHDASDAANEAEAEPQAEAG